MRAGLRGLATPFPLGESLPGMFQDDDFAQRFCAGLDEVLAPVVGVLDCLPAYLDPVTTPEDLLIWLGGWTGTSPHPEATGPQRRALVGGAVALHRHRGTARGVREAVALHLGVDAEVLESGAAAWSTAPGADLPGEATPGLLVRVRAADPGAVDLDRLAEVVAEACPAHVPHRVEVIGEGVPDDRSDGVLRSATPAS